MTDGHATAAEAPRPPLALQAAGRVEVAWNASAPRTAGPARYASAALRLEVSWPGGDGRCPAACSASLDAAGTVAQVALPTVAWASVSRHGNWVHVQARTDDGAMLLEASFERDRLAYCRSCVPEHAGLRGGSYESPTAILESYGNGAGTA